MQLILLYTTGRTHYQCNQKLHQYLLAKFFFRKLPTNVLNKLLFLMYSTTLTTSMPINGIFNTRQQQQVHKQRQFKTVNYHWDSISFMAWARVQMTGMANELDDLVSCAPSPQNDNSVSLTVLLVGRPSNGDSLKHSWTRLAGITNSPPACKTTIVSRSLSYWSSSVKYSSNKVLIWSRSLRAGYQQTYYIEPHFSTRYVGQVCDVVELHSAHASMDII